MTCQHLIVNSISIYACDQNFQKESPLAPTLAISPLGT